MKYTDRSRYLYDYKTKDDKNALEKLILTYVPYIEHVISKYNYHDLDELMSVGIESVLNSIITYPNSTTLKLLNTRVSNRLNIDIINFISEQQNNDSYEEYFKNRKNSEQYSCTMNIEYINPNLTEELNVALDKLKPIEKSVIEMRYGINGKRTMTLMEIAEELNFTHQYIAKIEKKTLKKLYSSNYKKLRKFL